MLTTIGLAVVCLACHPSQKDAGPMTDTAAREEAVERVRAYVEAVSDWHSGLVLDRGLVAGEERPLTLGDLRLLLTDPRQPSEEPYRDDTALKFPTGEGGGL